MSSSFLDSFSSSASSPLSYLILSPPPPPPPPLMGQGYTTNGVSVGVQTSGAVDAASAVAAAPRQGSRHAGHPPLPRPPPRQCPRCGSANTKFCYYNNYSRTQPRYRCKACRRHWTEGGTLRDVPVGGVRKNKRSGGKGEAKAASTATAASSGGGAVDAFPDILRQMLFQPATAVGGGGYSIDLSAWQQMVAATAPPQGASDVGAVGGTAPDANCGGVQYWNGWQQDDMPGLDGAC